MKEYFTAAETRKIEIEALGRSVWCKGVMGEILFIHGTFYDDEVCPICGQLADYLCDAPMKDENGKTKRCDLPICIDHATIIGEDLHVCPAHKERDGYCSTVFIKELPATCCADNKNNYVVK